MSGEQAGPDLRQSPQQFVTEGIVEEDLAAQVIHGATIECPQSIDQIGRAFRSLGKQTQDVQSTQLRQVMTIAHSSH